MLHDVDLNCKEINDASLHNIIFKKLPNCYNTLLPTFGTSGLR